MITPEDAAYREQQRKQIREAFRGLDVNESVSEDTPKLANQRIGKARAANIAWLSSQTGVSTKEIAKVYDIERPRQAEAVFGILEDPGDEGFYKAIAKNFDTEDKARAGVEDAYLQGVNRAVVSQFVESPEGDRYDIPWAQEYEAYAKERKGDFPPEHEKLYAQAFRGAFSSGAAESAETKDIALDLLDQLKIEEGVEVDGPITNAKPEVLQRLALLTAEERQRVYAFLNANVDLNTIPEDWAASTTKAFNRGFENLFGNVKQLQVYDRIQLVKDYAGSGGLAYVSEPKPEDTPGEKLMRIAAPTRIGRGFIGQALIPNRPVPPEDYAEIMELIPQAEAELAVFDELRDLRQQSVNPVKTDSFVAGKMWYPLLGQVAHMASSKVLPVYIAANTRSRMLEAKQNGMSDEQARNIGFFSSLMEAPIERLQLKGVFGGGFSRALRKTQNSLKSQFGSLAAGFAGQVVEQNIQEGIQDFMPTLVQAVASNLSEEYPDVNWGEALKGFAESRPDTFWALLPLAALGAGIGTASDIGHARRYLAQADRVEALGVDRAKAEEIAEKALTDEAAASKMFQDAPKGDINFKAFNGESELVESMINSPDRPQISVLDDGRAEVEFDSGNVSTFEDVDAALQGVNDYVDARANSAREAVGALIKEFEEKGTAEFVMDLQDKTVSDLISEGVLSTEEARQRIADLSAETGLEFNDNVFAQFPVFAQNEATFKDGVFNNAVRVFRGDNPLAIVEDVSEGHYKMWIAGGERGRFETWLDQYQKASGDILVEDVASASDKSLVEGLSSLSTAYFTRNMDRSKVAPVLKKLLQQFAELFRHIFARAASLEGAFKDGKLDPEFETKLAESVGLDIEQRQNVMDRVAARAAVRDFIRVGSERPAQVIENLGRKAAVRDFIREGTEKPIGLGVSVSDLVAEGSLHSINISDGSVFSQITDAVFGDLATVVGDVEVELIPPSGDVLMGFFNTSTGKILLSSDYALYPEPAKILLRHESVHAATVNQYDTNSEFRSEVNRLSFLAANSLPQDFIAAIRKFDSNKLIREISKPGSTIESVVGVEFPLGGYTVQEQKFIAYALVDPYEFMAMGITDGGTTRFLASIKDPKSKGKSVLRKLWEAFASAAGAKANFSVFDSLATAIAKVHSYPGVSDSPGNGMSFDKKEVRSPWSDILLPSGFPFSGTPPFQAQQGLPPLPSKPVDVDDEIDPAEADPTLQDGSGGAATTGQSPFSFRDLPGFPNLPPLPDLPQPETYQDQEETSQTASGVSVVNYIPRDSEAFRNRQALRKRLGEDFRNILVSDLARVSKTNVELREGFEASDKPSGTQLERTYARVSEVWGNISLDEMSQTFGKTKSTRVDDIAAAVSLPGFTVVGASVDGKGMPPPQASFKVVETSASISVHADGTIRGRPAYTINAMGSAPNGKQLYTAALDWLRNNGFADKNFPSLTVINKKRKVSNVLASALRWGTFEHLNTNSQMEVSIDAKPETFRADLAKLALREAELTLANSPALGDSLKVDFDRGVLVDGEGNPHTAESIREIVTKVREDSTRQRNPDGSLGSQSGRSSHVGLATILRSLITEAAMNGDVSEQQAIGLPVAIANAKTLPQTFSIGSPELEAALESYFAPPEIRIEQLTKSHKRLREIEARFMRLRTQADQNKTLVSRLDVQESIAQMEAIVAVLPTSVRGQVPGFATLAGKAGDKGRLTYLLGRIDRVATVLDRAIAKDNIAKFKKLVERSKAKKNASGKLQSTLGPQGAQFIEDVRKFMVRTTEEIDSDVTALKESIGRGVNDSDRTYELIAVAEQFGALNSMDAESSSEALQALKDNIKTGRSDYRLKIEARRNENQNLILQAQEDGKLAPSPDAEDVAAVLEAEREGWTRFAKFTKGWLVEALSFRQALITMFGYGSTTNHFERKAQEAKNQMIDNTLARRAEQAAWMKDALGLASTRKQLAWMADLKEVEEDTGIVTSAGKPVSLSQDQAIYYTMVWDQPAYRQNLETHNGFTQDTIAAMEDWLKPESRQFRSWLHNKYATEYDRINDVYKDQNGVNMPRVKTYAPVSVDLGAGSDLQMEPFGNSSLVSGLAAGFTKLRTNHNLKIRRQGASAVYWAHAQQEDYYVAYADLARQMRAVLLNKEVVEGLTLTKGSRRVKALNMWVDQFHNNGARRAAGLLAMEEWSLRMQTTTALVGLAWNLGTLVKQASAVMGSALEIPFTAWVKGLGSLLVNPSRFIKIFNSDTMSRRIEGGMSIEMQLAMSAANASPSLIMAMVRKGLPAIGYVDAAFTSVGGAIAYDYHLREARKTMPEAEAQRVAMQQLDLTVGRTAQPASNMDRSLTEIHLDGNALGRIYMMFKSEPRQKIAIAMMAARNLIRGERKMEATRAVFVTMFVMPVMTHIMSEWFASVFRDKDDEDGLWSTEDLMHAIITGQSAGLFFIGDAIDFMSSTAFDQQLFSGDDQVTSSVASLARLSNKIVSGDFGKDGEDFTAQELTKDFNSGARAVSMLLGGRAAALGVSSRIMKDVANGADWFSESVVHTEAAGVEKKLVDLQAKQKEMSAAKRAEDAKEKPKLGKTLRRLRSLEVGSGLRAEGIKAVLDAAPSAERADLIKQLEDAKILTPSVHKQLLEL